MNSPNHVTASNTSDESESARSKSWWNIFALGLFCAAVFATVVFFSTRHNDFPVYFHQNSGSQTKEIRRGEHNFKQPLLLITATQIARVIADPPDNSQAICELGNDVAAVFGGLTAVNLVLLAFLLRGWLGAVCVGGVVSLCSPLIYYGHFFKEDTALVFGLTLVFLALAWFLRRPTPRSIVLLGAACGLAVAGKYVGIFGVLIAVPALLLADVRRGGATVPRTKRWQPFVFAFIATYLVANYQILTDFKDFMRGVRYEIMHVSSGVSDHGYQMLERAKSLEKYVKYVDFEIPWLVIIAAGVGILLILIRWKRHATIEKVIALFTIVFALIVTQSTLQESRHFLPAWLMLHFIAGMGIVHLVSWRGLGKVAPWLISIALLGPVMYVELERVQQRNSEFPRDSRFLMADWIAANLPPDAKIAADTTCGLPDPEYKYHDGERRRLPQEVVTEKYAPDLGSMDELLAQGFTHAAVSKKRISQVSNERRVPLEHERERHDHRSSFYRELQERGTLLWESHLTDEAAPRMGFSGEKLMLYALPKTPNAPGPAAVAEESPEP